MNKVFLIGRLTANPEIRYSKADNTYVIAKYTLAVDRKSNKDPNENNANFIRCIALGKSGEFAEKYLYKGQKIAVVGRLETGSYVNNDGVKVYTTDVIVDEHDFAESKRATPGEV